MGKKILRAFLFVLLFLFIAIIALLIAIRQPAFQTYLAHRFTAILSNSLETKVSIERVELSFFHDADLINFYLEDRQHDTLISAKELKIQFKLFQLFDKKIKVSRIFLNEGTFHLHRDSTGKVLNLTQVFEKFQSNKKATPQTPGQFTWDIDLDEMELQKTDFKFLDEKAHLDLKVNVPSCLIAISDVDFKKNTVLIKSVKIDKANVLVDLLKRGVTPDDTTGEFHFLKGGPIIKFDEFALTNSNFRLTDHNSDTVFAKGMDFKHLNLSGINLMAKRGGVVEDTIFAFVKSLSAKEQSGFNLESMTADTRVSVHEITLDKLNIKTPHSEVKNYLSFRYNSFRDFKDFFNAVRIKAKLDDSKLSVKDLNYFVRNLDKVAHNQFTINGELDGRLNNLKGRGIEIRTGQNTILKGDFYTKGLPKIYEASLNARISRLATTAADVKAFYPGIQLPDNLNALGLIYYTGSLDGFITDFVSKGKLVTAIGSATTDIDFKYDKDKNKATYDGNLTLDEFDLGKYFYDQQLLGKISLNTKIKGGGLTLESLKAQLDGVVTSVTFKGYEYKGIQVNGSVVKKSFNGLLSIHDQYLDMDFNGKADLTRTVPEFNFDANIRKAMLKNLNLIKDDIQVAGKMKSNFKGNKPDNLVGSLQLKDVTLRRDSITALVKYFNLDAKLLANEKKSITLVSDFAEAEMTGNFTLKELPITLINFAKYTFTKDYEDTSAAKASEDFNVDLRIYEPGNLTQIIQPKFYVLRSSHITCDFSSAGHKINLMANIPQLTYGNFDIRRAVVNLTSNDRTFDFHTSVDRVYNGDSVLLDSVIVTSKTEGPEIRFAVRAADKNQYNYVNLTAFLTPLKGKAIARIDTSDVKLGNNNWHFDPNNSIFMEGKKITTSNLIFRTNDQSIFISSYLKNDTSTSLKLTLDNTNLADFAKSFTTKVKDLYGIVNGSLVVEDLFYTPHVYADLVVNEFTLGKELIGDINIESRLDSVGKNILVRASVKSFNNNLDASGTISLDAAHPDLNIDVKGSRVGLNFLNYSFFDKYVKNCKGYSVVNANVYGTLKKPLLKGDVTLVDDTVTVSFLNTTYHLHNQHVRLDAHGFDLGNITIYDVKGKEAFGTGRINHESFRDFALDIIVTTGDKPVQFINTTPKDNPNFYGVAYGTGNVIFSGPINSPVIRAYATTGPNTYCKMPINSSYETSRYSFYKFLGHGKDTIANRLAPQLRLNGVTFSLDVDVTDDARMDIILDPISGDLLSGYGHGHLQIAIPKNSNTTIRGTFEVDHGNYLFTLQNVINKRFEINQGGTIEFNGEINKAKLNMKAVYEIRSSLTDLLDAWTGSSPAIAAAAQSRIPIQLLLSLTGVLERPNIAFDIKVNDADPTIQSYVDQRLALLRNNESDMNKQVFGLLVMNRFIPSSQSTQSSLNGSNASGTATNTVSQFVSSQLSNYLGNLLEFANIRNLDVNIGYQSSQSGIPSQQNGTTTTQSTLDTRQELNLALTQRLLNNRLSINAGGNLDFGSGVVTDVNGNQVAVAGGKTVIPTGDFQVAYSLTPSGIWKAKVFNRTNYDYLNSRNTNKTGVGISYRQEFDKPSELVKKKKKKADPNQKELPKKDENVSPEALPISK